MNIFKGILELFAMLAGAAFVLLFSFQVYLWFRLGTWVPLTLLSITGEQGLVWVDHFTVQVLRDICTAVMKIPLLVVFAVVAAGSWLGVRSLRNS